MAKNSLGLDLDDPGWDEVLFLKMVITVGVPLGLGIVLGYVESGFQWMLEKDVLIPAEGALVPLPYGAGLDVLRLIVAGFVAAGVFASGWLWLRSFTRSRVQVDDLSEAEYRKGLGR